MSSPCDTCPKPGSCCKGFTISKVFPEGVDVKKVQAFLDEEELPYTPSKPCSVAEEDGGRRWTYDCPKLLLNGRCGIYADRPKPCRNYEPATDSLCVLYVPEEKAS